MKKELQWVLCIVLVLLISGLCFATKAENEGGSEKAEDVSTTAVVVNGMESAQNLQQEYEKLKSKSEYVTGLYYYVQKYLYDCNITFLEKNVEYVTLQESVQKNAYELGNITQAELDISRANTVLAQAELQQAQNESAYNEVYLKQNNSNVNQYDIKKIKKIQNLDVYKESNPQVDIMTIARTITDFNNAVVQISAKQAQVEALTKEVTMTKLLYEAGEVSKLQFVEKELSCAKAQFELEKSYVDMNTAYLQLLDYEEKEGSEE